VQPFFVPLTLRCGLDSLEYTAAKKVAPRRIVNGATVTFPASMRVGTDEDAGSRTTTKMFILLAEPRLEPKAERILDRVPQDSPSFSKPPILL
jgi:hypothetical protein